MEEIIGVSASAAGGGLFGLVGTALGRLAGFFEKRQSMAHEAQRWAHEAMMLNLQHRAAVETAAAELEKVQIEGSWSGLRESLAAETAIASSYRWVDALRALTRPILTVLLWAITTTIWFTSDMAGKSGIAETATFAATAATLWWFGDRSARLPRAE